MASNSKAVTGTAVMARSANEKKKTVVVYSEEVLQGSASVLLRLTLPPHDAEGAIYVRRRLRLPYLIRQLGISPLCGDDGDECLCYVNGMELTYPLLGTPCGGLRGGRTGHNRGLDLSTLI